jgi:phosphate/sulfate permease
MITEKSKKEIVAMALSVNLGLPLAFIIGIPAGAVGYMIEQYFENGVWMADALLMIVMSLMVSALFGIWYAILIAKNKKRLAPIDANPNIPIRFESVSGVKGTLHIGDQRITIWGQVNKKKFAEATALLAQISEHPNANPSQTPFS